MKDSSISFWFVPPEIAELDLGLTEKSILAVVYSFTRNGGGCWATDKQFAAAFGMGERTIERAISRLYVLGYLQRHVERISGGITPRRLSLTLPYRQIDATPHEELPPYRQIDATLAPNCPPPTVKMTLGYRQNDAQIESNINKEKVTISSPLRGTQKIEIPISESETQFEDSVVKESLTTQESPSLVKPSEESPPPPIPPGPPSTLDALDLPPEIRAAADRWMEHRRLKGKPVSVKRMGSEIRKYGVDLPRVVEQSISKGWQGLFAVAARATTLHPWVKAETDLTHLFGLLKAGKRDEATKFRDTHPALGAALSAFLQRKTMHPKEFASRLDDSYFEREAFSSLKALYQANLTKETP